ncbi:ABC transporter permease [Halobacteriales archaeon QS_8_69_26]|nr:MAG: ABC transporter permease [Halobacteriales archaeon QS_8_69_26]
MAGNPDDSDGDRSWWRDPRLVIARREVASLKSEKTIVLALLIQLFVAAFSSFLVVGLVSLYDPGSVEGFTVEAGLSGNASGEVRESISREEGIDPSTFGSPDGTADAFERGAIDVVIRANYTADGTIRAVVIVPSESLRTTLIVVKTRETLESMEERLRQEYSMQDRLDVEPLSVPDRTQSSPYFSFTYTVLIPLLMFLPAFISGSIAVDSITEETQRGTLELLRSAPVDLAAILDAKMLSTATLAPVQAALWLLLLELNGTRIAGWLPLVVLVAGISTTVVAVGVGISLLTPERRQAQFLYSTAILAVATLTFLLPEHPANTVAKLAIGSPTLGTYLAVAAYAALGVAAYLIVRIGIERVDPEGL